MLKSRRGCHINAKRSQNRRQSSQRPRSESWNGSKRQIPSVFTSSDLDLAILAMVFLERYEFLVNTKKDVWQWKELPFKKGEESRITGPPTVKQYPIHHIQDFTNSWHDINIYNETDLLSAYHNIPLAITILFRLFQFLHLPFGLKIAAQTFQRFMHNLLSNIPFAHSYIDDLLIASSDLKSHG